MSSLSGVLLELNELDDVSLGGASRRVSEKGAIGVELLHHLELLLADTNNDDG